MNDNKNILCIGNLCLLNSYGLFGLAQLNSVHIIWIVYIEDDKVIFHSWVCHEWPINWEGTNLCNNVRLISNELLFIVINFSEIPIHIKWPCFVISAPIVSELIVAHANKSYMILFFVIGLCFLSFYYHVENIYNSRFHLTLEIDIDFIAVRVF